MEVFSADVVVVLPCFTHQLGASLKQLMFPFPPLTFSPTQVYFNCCGVPERVALPVLPFSSAHSPNCTMMMTSQRAEPPALKRQVLPTPITPPSFARSQETPTG